MPVVHETPGLIDVRSFTVFGINAKPNTDNPIGRFGTGLKYAVSVLVRTGHEVTVWVGEEPHVFFTKTRDFRGKSFQQIYMRRKRGVTARWMATELPYTTEYGKDWQVWMALRELHSNTLDESGQSYSLDGRGHPVSTTGEVDVDVEFGKEVGGYRGYTRVVVSGQEYEAAFADLGKTFLPNASRDVPVQVVDRPSDSMYYRGLRARDLQKPSVLTWNVNDALVLTEDRTIKEQYVADWSVKRTVMASTDRELIRRVLTAGDDRYESTLTYYEHEDSSPEFREVARVHGRRSAASYFAAYSKREDMARSQDWREQLLIALATGETQTAGQVALTFRVSLEALLKQDIKSRPNCGNTEDDVPF